jgi:hypothetical protein
VLQGSTVAVALPLLDVFLDPHGEAVAKPDPGADAKAGEALPTCFGTWYWGLGLCHGLWEPKEIGANFKLNEHLQSLAPIMGKFNVYSGMQALMDGKTNLVHYSSVQAQYTGTVGMSYAPNVYGRSFDQDIAKFFGARGVVFPSMTVSTYGTDRASWSSPGPSVGMNPPEVSPLTLYTKMFGPSFVDPNAADFQPNPTVMVSSSVLSAVSDERRALMRILPAPDRARLDAYFSSVRDLENQFQAQLEKPQPLPSCVKPEGPPEHVGSEITDMARTHKQFAQLQAHAFSCGLTRVWNTAVTYARTHQAGDPTGHHEHTHVDPIDAQLGYQPQVKWYADQYLGMFAELVQTLDSIKEGKGTLLDRVLLMAATDHGSARAHSITEIPIFTAGFANGRMRNGLHVNAPGDTVCRVGLTCQQAVGMPIATWGTLSNTTSKPFSEVLV